MQSIGTVPNISLSGLIHLVDVVWYIVILFSLQLPILSKVAKPQFTAIYLPFHNI